MQKADFVMVHVVWVPDGTFTRSKEIYSCRTLAEARFAQLEEGLTPGRTRPLLFLDVLAVTVDEGRTVVALGRPETVL